MRDAGRVYPVRGCRSMSTQPSHVAFSVVATTAVAFACDRQSNTLQTKADSAAGNYAVSSQPIAAIPPDDSLARPKSLQQVGVPVALTRSVIPSDNPQTPEKIALGEKLFFDGRVSANGTVACATCHDPRLAFTDSRP